MTKLAQKLQAATAASRETEDELRVEMEDGSTNGGDLPVQEVFSYILKGFTIWLFFQLYLFLNTSLPAFENYIGGQINTINSAVRNEIKSSDGLKEILPAAGKANALSVESIRELIGSPTSSTSSFNVGDEKRQIRRH